MPGGLPFERDSRLNKMTFLKFKKRVLFSATPDHLENVQPKP